MKPATLALEDGTVIEGQGFGAETDTVFELVFNTSLTGYQEILTDPSYRGQAVLFTAAHIGNVGINLEDDESARPQVSAAVIRSLSPVVSNWRSATSLPDWLAHYGIPGITGVDTRWLTRKLRDGGTQNAALSTRGTCADELLKLAREWSGLDGRDMVREVTCEERYHWQEDAGSKWVQNRRPGTVDHERSTVHRPWSVVAYDFGIKENILRHLSSYGAHVTVVPADASAEEVLALNPDGVFLSNGPGRPGRPSVCRRGRARIDRKRCAHFWDLSRSPAYRPRLGSGYPAPQVWAPWRESSRPISAGRQSADHRSKS